MGERLREHVAGAVLGGRAQEAAGRGGQPHARGSDEDATAHDFEDGHDKIVVDATAVGSAVETKSVTEQLRELSSFDDLSDELAI